MVLSYQHGYHAGHFADVHKHVVLTLLLKYLRRGVSATAATPPSLSSSSSSSSSSPAENKGLWLADTHAGCGRYSLGGPQSLKTRAWRAGIGRLWSYDYEVERVQSEGLRLYLDLVRTMNDVKGMQKWKTNILLFFFSTCFCW